MATAFDPLAGFPQQGLPVERLAVLEGRQRSPSANRPALGRLLSDVHCIRILAASPRGEGDPTRTLAWAEATLAFLAGLAASETPLIYVLLGRNQQLEVYLGTPGGGEVLVATTTAVWPGMVIQPTSGAGIGVQLDSFSAAAAGFGFPAPRLRRDGQMGEEQLDRLVRAHIYSKAPWAYVVLAYPLSPHMVACAREAIAEEIRQIRIQFQVEETAARYDQHATDYLKALSTYHAKMQLAQAVGGWAVVGYILAGVQQLPALIASTATALAGPGAEPEPYTLRACGPIDPAYHLTNADVTFMPSTDLMALVHPPLNEVPGYATRAQRRLSVAPPASPEEPRLALGFVRDTGRPTGGQVEISLEDLTSHMFIAGITGAGKTNTIFDLLHQVWGEHRIPFLVLEPVKGEYRLLQEVFSELRLYRLGQPGAGLSLNPFAFQGVSLHTHLDYLKALFSAAYVLYPPMPYILEQSLHEIYADKGWDLLTGHTWREPADHPRAWPTLSDLYRKVGEVTDRAGYDVRVRLDVRAGLQVRVNNLRLGAKGVLLDTHIGLNVADLLAQPAVIDLSAIGDEEQRAFLLGLLLLNLYEFCVARGWSGGVAPLHNLIVFEEAHRFLRNVPRQSGPDTANMQGQAIETFANLLAEIRAYRVGFVVAEQIPTKLAPEVLKNTGTKVIHRLVDREERLAVGAGLNLAEDQLDELSRLGRGEALVFAPRMDRPVRVKFRERKSDNATTPPPAFVTPDPWAALAFRLADEVELQQAFRRVLLSGIEGDGAPAFEQFRDLIRQRSPLALNDEQQVNALALAVARRLADGLASDLGRRYGWRFDVEEQLQHDLEQMATNSVRGGSCLAGREWAQAFRRQVPPFRQCAGRCVAVCSYRPFIESTLDKAARQRFAQIMDSDSARWTTAAYEVLALATQTVTGPASALRGPALCILIHLAQAYSPVEWDRDQIVEHTWAALEKAQEVAHEN